MKELGFPMVSFGAKLLNYVPAEGEKMDQVDRYKLAVHEAGHAVMAIACGFRGVRIELSEKENSLGRCLIPIEEEANEEFHAKHALVALSGMLSERIITGETPPIENCSGDLEKATSHIARTKYKIEELFLKASLFLSDIEIKNVIEEIAIASLTLETEESFMGDFSAYTSRINSIRLP